MKIRAKVAVLLAALFLVLTAVEWWIGQAFLLPRFEQIEIDNAHTAMKRIENSMQQTLSEVLVSATDWGNWRDTYDYMRDRSPQYEEANLTETALKQLGLRLMAFIDLNGDIVMSRSLDADTGSFVPLQLFPHNALPDGILWRNNLANGRAGTGLILTDDGILLAAVTPILDGFGNGPSRGLVLMGRLLTESEIVRIGQRAQTGVVRVPLREAAGQTIRTGEQTTSAYRTLPDIYGRPVLALRADIPRAISKGARATVNTVLAFTIGAAVVVLLILMFTLDRTVLAPLARVTRHAVAIGTGDDLTSRLNLARGDEIGVLAAEFDRMVAKLAESRRQVIDQSFHAGMGEISRGVLHNIGNAMTPLAVRLERLRGRLLAAPIADVEIALAESGTDGGDERRRADLHQFLRLSGAELVESIRRSIADVELIIRQAAIVQGALNEQSPSSRAPTVIEATQLAPLIEQCLDVVPDNCRELVSIELDPSLQAVGTVHVARTVLRLVLQNLVINAAEAIRAAGRDRGVVRFSAAWVRDDGRHLLQLDCTDSGIGIAAGDLERVFERGYSTKREFGNQGIGLHWCANAINSLGGRMWATSAGPNRGATLHLQFPVPVPAAQAGARAA
jgi:sensor domain CHASE-containing protein